MFGIVALCLFLEFWVVCFGSLLSVCGFCVICLWFVLFTLIADSLCGFVLLGFWGLIVFMIGFWCLLDLCWLLLFVVI